MPHAGSSGGGSGTHAQQQMQVLRQQQQRLLLLRHASKCPVQDPEVCNATPHCKQMKQLWHHIAKCKNNTCQFPHCVSSRYVLSHYHRCKNPACDVCRPVKEAIKNSDSKRGAGSSAGGGPAAPAYANYPPSSLALGAGGTGTAPPDQTALLKQLQEERAKAERAARAHEEKARQLEEKLKELERGGAAPAVTNTSKKERRPLRRSASSKNSRATVARQDSGARQTLQQPPPPPPTAAMPPMQRGGSLQGPPSQAHPYARLTPAQRMALEQQKQMRSGNSSMAYSANISLINTLHQDDIKNHIASLVRFSANSRPGDIKNKMSNLLRTQLDMQFAYIFLKPVDPIAMDIPDYFDVIKNPMDLTTIRRRVEAGYYKTLKDFASDVLLVYDNAILYNPETKDGYGVNETAKEYAQIFVEEHNKTLLRMKEEEARKRKSNNSCRLCGGGRFVFEPPVYYCIACNQKIRRNAHYYTTPDNKMLYCVSCFGGLRSSTIEMEDGSTIAKSQLTKKRNDEETEESWVQCNQCNRWYHQICAMFNGRADENKNSAYFCPMCILRNLDRLRVDRIPEQMLNQRPNEGIRAKDLPRTKFSDYIEEKLTKRILAERKKEAERLGVRVADVREPGEITVRVVLHKETEVIPRQNLERIYKDEPYNYPKSFPHRVKCILMFQCIDGIDTLVFALYTQSYGTDCPKPNQRCLYISYLDSVHFMRPRFIRTPMYHELLIATIEYEKAMGIVKTFIWACPPLAGDDYILYCHPKEQKTQKAEMLRQWYSNLLEDARQRGIVVSVDNLYDKYIRRLCNPVGIPNFEGDYWPGVTEQFITELEKEGVDPRSPAPRAKRSNNRNKTAKQKSGKKDGKKSKSAKNSKKKSKTKAKARTTSVGGAGNLNDMDIGGDNSQSKESNPIWPPPTPAKWIQIAQQDALTSKIGEQIKQMKDDFFVVHLHHICAECAVDIDESNMLYWLPKTFEEGMGELDVSKNNKYTPPFCLCHDCYTAAYKKEFDKEPVIPDMPTQEDIEKKEAEEEAKHKAEEEARKKAEEEAKKKTEEENEAKKNAEEGSKIKTKEGEGAAESKGGLKRKDLSEGAHSSEGPQQKKMKDEPVSSSELENMKEEKGEEEEDERKNNSGASAEPEKVNVEKDAEGDAEMKEDAEEKVKEEEPEEMTFGVTTRRSLRNRAKAKKKEDSKMEVDDEPAAKTTTTDADAAKQEDETKEEEEAVRKENSEMKDVKETVESAPADQNPEASSSSSIAPEAPVAAPTEEITISDAVPNQDGIGQEGAQVSPQPPPPPAPTIQTVTQPMEVSAEASPVSALQDAGSATSPVGDKGAEEEQEILLPPNTIAKPQNPWKTRPVGLDEMEVHRMYIRTMTKDPDPLMDEKYFDTRQQFLSLCQGNRYQFDQLRRAKHSSMMVLYHLHHPDEAGFVHSCNICQKEIKDDSWFKCTECNDFDSCNSCHATQPHPHRMQRIEQKSKARQEQLQRDRSKHIAQHMELLAHASACRNAKCQKPNCQKMKALLAHGKNCTVRLRGGCRICRRIWILLQIHARKCTVPRTRTCPVPRCADIREHLRRAQAQLSDRRIQAQTHRLQAERQRPPTGPNGSPAPSPSNQGGYPQQPGHFPPPNPQSHPHAHPQSHAPHQYRHGAGKGGNIGSA